MTDASYPWEDPEGPATRTPRAVDGREVSQRPTGWKRPTVLPEIPPRDGWSFKWIRVSNANGQEQDKKNFNKSSREGWTPVRIEEFPWIADEMKLEQTAGTIETGGLLLCKMPIEWVEERNRTYANEARAQRTSAEESYMRDDREIAMRKVVEKNRSVFTDRR